MGKGTRQPPAALPSRVPPPSLQRRSPEAASWGGSQDPKKALPPSLMPVGAAWQRRGPWLLPGAPLLRGPLPLAAPHHMLKRTCAGGPKSQRAPSLLPKTKGPEEGQTHGPHWGVLPDSPPDSTWTPTRPPAGPVLGTRGSTSLGGAAVAPDHHNTSLWISLGFVAPPSRTSGCYTRVALFPCTRGGNGPRRSPPSGTSTPPAPRPSTARGRAGSSERAGKR